MKNILKNIKTCSKTFLALSILAASVGTYADDTEVFYSLNVSKPNLLFVLDVSGSMDAIVTTAGGGQIIQSNIVASGDDATHRSGNSVVTTSNVHMIDASSGYISARFRFTDIDIPQGASITNAYIQFEAASDDFNNASFRIYSESTNNAPAIKDSHFSGGFSQGPDWNVTQNWLSGDRGTNQRVDVTQVTQSVINRGGWSANNAIALYVDTKNGRRTMAAFDHPTAVAPQLFVEFAEAKDRLQVMQESLREVLETAPDNVKVGLMNYGQESLVTGNAQNYRHNSVSGIAFPITDINAKARDVIPTAADVYGLPSYPSETITIREYIADIADTWNHTSFTPIVDALYEAALYYRGERMHYGQNDPNINGAHPSTYAGSVVTTNVVNTSGPGRVLDANSPKYISPIESSCQENYIVLMTDGAPTYRVAGGSNGNSNPGPLASGTSLGPQGTLADAIGSCATGAGVGVAGTCGAELTSYIANADNIPNPTSSYPTGQEGNQYIKTFTVGFGTGAGTNTEKFLKSLATYDDGDASTDDDGYFLASSPEELAAAFADILAEVAAPKGTLASPGYSVNVKNGLEHEKDIYIPVFDRKNSSRWSGNLKKFKIVDSNQNRSIVGKNNALATDELGNFTTDALDYWSTSSVNDPDGRNVQRGGVANLLDPDTRKMYSNLSGDSNVNLVTSSNRIDVANLSNLTNDVLGLDSGSSDDYRKTIINFMRGWKNGVTDTSALPAPEKRFYMGDMLHSEPLVMTYNKGTGASQVGKQQYIFAGTNEGILHAFDAQTGEEKFAFMPRDLLGTLAEPLFLNAGSAEDHKYGIDGAITGDFTGGEDGSVDPGDQVVIYVGMRRGGSAYYALDVTDINSPKLLWKKSAADHSSMGQSWGTPYVATVADSNGNPKEVLIVTGGYDEDEDRDKNDGSQEVDDSTVSVTADVGNDIFIFDAKTGSKVWSMPDSMRSQIKNSIAGGIRPLDTNSNNLIDRLYFGDTGGNVWRLDYSEHNGEEDSVTKLTKLASVGGSGANNRMFFNEPDVALMRLNGRSVYAVSIGSGFRAHPMDRAIDDKFYVFVDNAPFDSLETEDGPAYTTITESNLASITISSSGGVSNTGLISDANKRGLIINLPENGEKVLGDATAINGSIIFPTLVPEVLATGVGIDQCAAPVTYSRLYAIDILSSSPKWDLNGDGTPVPFTEPLTTEIISSIDKVFNTPEPAAEQIGADGQPTGEFECRHTVDLRVGKKNTQVSGYNTCRLEPVYWSDPLESEN